MGGGIEAVEFAVEGAEGFAKHHIQCEMVGCRPESDHGLPLIAQGWHTGLDGLLGIGDGRVEKRAQQLEGGPLCRRKGG